MAEPASFCAGVTAIVLVIAPSLANLANEAIHDHLEEKINPHPMYGTIQKKAPLVRTSRQMVVSPPRAEEPGHEVQYIQPDNDMSDKEWMDVPHIRAICYAAKERAGFLSYYWCKKFVVLNKMYLDWLHSLPMNSPLHREGNYEKVFMELHIKHFNNGIYGRTRSTFVF